MHFAKITRTSSVPVVNSTSSIRTCFRRYPLTPGKHLPNPNEQFSFIMKRVSSACECTCTGIPFKFARLLIGNRWAYNPLILRGINWFLSTFLFTLLLNDFDTDKLHWSHKGFSKITLHWRALSYKLFVLSLLLYFYVDCLVFASTETCLNRYSWVFIQSLCICQKWQKNTLYSFLLFTVLERARFLSFVCFSVCFFSFLSLGAFKLSIFRCCFVSLL